MARLIGLDMPPQIQAALDRCKSHFIAAAVFSFLMNTLFLAPPLYMLQVYDRAVPSGSVPTLLFLTIALAIALVTLSALDAIRLRLLVRAGARLDRELAPIVIRRAVEGGTGGVQALRDFDTLRSTIASPAVAALMDLPWVPMFVIVAFLVHWSIGVLALLAAALVAALAWRNQDATRPAMEDATKQMAAAQIWTQSAGAHAEAVRSLGMTGSVVEKAFAQRREAIEGLIGAQFSGSSYTAASRFVRLFVQSLGLGLGALLAIDGKISSGAIIAASIIIGRALQPVDAVIAGWSSLASARAALHRLSVNLGAERLHFERTRLPPPSGKLSLDQVALKAGDGRPILFGITVEVEPGQVLAVIGPSGSGKTSLLKIMSGAIPATVGTVRIDGAQYSDWDSDELGSHVGYLPQQPSLLEGTIRDNICRFSTSVAREATDAAVVEAAIQAGVHELILQLPNGYDTVVAPMGSSLSAGQAQRIALARALYGAPSLIVLDEPNAWLDSDGEAALARAVKEIKGRRAAVVIAAHRRSVLEYADRVLVLDSGRPRLLGETSKVLARLVGPPQSESVA